MQPTLLALAVTSFARYRLAPTDEKGKFVNLDAGALTATKTAGPDDASAEIFERVEAPEEGAPPIRVFYVDLIPSDTEGDQSFEVSGDAQPGAGVQPISQVFTLTGTGLPAANLNPVLQILSKADRQPPA